MTGFRAAYEALLTCLIVWYSRTCPPTPANFSAPLTRRLAELTQVDAAVRVLMLSDSGRAALVLLVPHDGSKSTMLIVPEPSSGESLH